MPPLDLEAIKARLAAATPGPWEAQRYTANTGGILVSEPDPETGGERWRVADTRWRWAKGGEPEQWANLVFIAHARLDVPALIAEVERLSVLPALISQIEARGWLWECGHSQGPFEPERRFYARLWLPSLDPMHDDEPWIDERMGWGASIEAATRQALEALP